MSNTRKFQMKLNRRGKILWSIVAFSPLFLILLLKFILSNASNPLIQCYILIGVVITAICFYLAWTLFMILEPDREMEDLMEIDCKINNSSNSDYCIFIVTYLVPFIFVDFSWDNLIPAGVMFIFVILMYINSPIFAINPILGFSKYNIYNAVIDGHSIVLISKRKLSAESYSMTLIQYADDVYYDIEREGL